jgi:Na+/H+ antiporter NhaC
MHLGPFDVAIAVLVFITVSAVAGIVADYKKRRLAVEALRAAIERGQPLDTALVERLIAPEQRKESFNPLWLTIGGIVTVAASIGVALFSVLLARIAEQALYPLLGIGAAALCVGAGLLVAARVVRAHQERAQPHGS